MKRTTISLPEALAAALSREARRRRVPVSQIAREAIEARLGLNAGTKRKVPFAALGRSGHRHTARDFDKILEADWAKAIDRDR
jgi:site-specific recombinase XerC